MISRPVHVSWLLASLALGVTIGVIAVVHAPYGYFQDIGWLMFGLSLALAAFVWPRRFMLVLALAAGLQIGLWRGSVGQIGLEDYAQFYGQSVEIKGRVLEDPDINKSGQTTLRLSDIRLNQRSVPGSVWISTAHNKSIKRSDNVTVRGKLAPGFGPFSAIVHRADIDKIERPVPGDVAVGVRDWFANRVRQEIPETEAALGLGFLMGLRRALPIDLVDALKIAGLTHVIVASGYNLTILVRLSRRLFVRKSKYLAMLASVAMILGFISMTGLSPSMSRAGLVALISLAAWYYGRKIHPLVLLPIAAATTLIINPQYGWNDLGWQLSFASFAGVIILAPLLQRYFFGDKQPGNIRQILGETISAQAMTMPLLIMAFGSMSNVSVIANLLVLPFVPLAMLMTFLTGILAGLPLISDLIAAPTTWLLNYMVSVADWLAGQSWASSELSLNWWYLLLIYLAMALAIWWMKKQTKFDLRDSNIVE